MTSPKARKREIKAAARAGVADSARTLTEKQREANRLLGSGARHLMLFGGGRSGKTFLLVRAIVVRAVRAADSRHLIARFRFAHVKQHVALDTFPAVMRVCFPGVPFKIDKSDWYVKFPNESEIWFGGLDEKERTEKILGAEYSTVYLNEVSQISWSARNVVMTRLAQKSGLPLRAYYDCNPPPQNHWSYKVFVRRDDPITGQPLPNKDAFAAMLMNPGDNREHIHEDYISELESLPERLRRRFLMGEWLPATENQLWNPEWFDEFRFGHDGDSATLPDLQRIVIAVDPSGASDDEEANNDAIGIIVAGVGVDGHCYVLEDVTVKAGPKTWGRAAATAYERHKADMVVGESNFGGDMVRFVIQTAKPGISYKAVIASRGKVVRAEPIAALYEQGKVHHVGRFPELEDELAGFTTAGHIGAKSPNRADALVWALTELFPGMVRKPRRDIVIEGVSGYDVHGF
jgi:predicted phage terminase large subunit-like protein